MQGIFWHLYSGVLPQQLISLNCREYFKFLDYVVVGFGLWFFFVCLFWVNQQTFENKNEKNQIFLL